MCTSIFSENRLHLFIWFYSILNTFHGNEFNFEKVKYITLKTSCTRLLPFDWIAFLNAQNKLSIFYAFIVLLDPIELQYFSETDRVRIQKLNITLLIAMLWRETVCVHTYELCNKFREFFNLI